MRLIAVSSLLVPAAAAAAALTPKQIYQQMGPGVVLILAADPGSEGASSGTGSIISKDGLVITNWHVVAAEDKARALKEIHVFLKPDKVVGNPKTDLTRHYLADLVQGDAALDLALLKIKNAPANLTVLNLGDPEDIGPGDMTVAIGHPEQGGMWTLTTGTIGARIDNFSKVDGKDVFQMETSLNRGNSGGPLFDARGYVVGVNTMIARMGQGGLAITGVNFALRSSVPRKWMESKGVSIAYGPMSLSEAVPEMYASAEAAPAAPPAAAAPAPPPPAEKAQVGGRGKFVHADAAHGVAPAPAPVAPAKPAPAAAAPGPRTGDPSLNMERPKRRRVPMKVTVDFQQPNRPFSMRQLNEALAAVRQNATDAMDDLEREAASHGVRTQ